MQKNASVLLPSLPPFILLVFLFLLNKTFRSCIACGWGTRTDEDEGADLVEEEQNWVL
jgi:hypothetical protein